MLYDDTCPVALHVSYACYVWKVMKWYVNDMIYVMIWYAWWHVHNMICWWYYIYYDVIALTIRRMLWYNIWHCIVWYDTLEDTICLWYDICLTWWNIWYAWRKIWCFDIMHNPDICMESYDKMIWYKGKWKGLLYMIMKENVGISCIIVCSDIGEYPSVYDGTDAYATRQENYHYIYYNSATVAISKGCLSTIVSENARPTKKGIDMNQETSIIQYASMKM